MHVPVLDEPFTPHEPPIDAPKEDAPPPKGDPAPVPE